MKKIIKLLLCTVLVLLCSSCQLAEEEVKEQTGDMFVGVLITTEHLSPEKIYASADNKFSLPNSYGYYNEYQQFDYYNSMWGTNVDDEYIREDDYTIDSDSGYELHDMEATLFYNAVYGEDILFFMNLVYQDSEGKIYAVAGNGLAMNLEYPTRSSSSYNQHDVATFEYNNKIKKQTLDIKVTMNYEPTHGVNHMEVLEMSKEGILLSKQIIDASIDTVVASEIDCEYLIIIEYLTDDTKDFKVVNREDNEFVVQTCDGGAVCRYHEIAVEW